MNYRDRSASDNSSVSEFQELRLGWLEDRSLQAAHEICGTRPPIHQRSAGDPTFDVNWSCGGGGGCNQSAVNLPPSPLSALGTFGNFAFSNGGTTFTMDVTVENTTPQSSLSLANWQSTRLTAIGFDTLPDATGISTTSTGVAG